MPESFSHFYHRTRYWWPAIMRALLYAFVTMISTFMVQSDKLNTAASLDWGWVEWFRFFLPIMATGMATIVAFLDQTMGKLREGDTQIWKPGETR